MSDSAYAEAARERKVSRVCHVLLGMYDRLSREKQATALADFGRLDEEGWQSLAGLAEVRPLSEASRALTLQRFAAALSRREQIASEVAKQDDPFSGLPGETFR